MSDAKHNEPLTLQGIGYWRAPDTFFSLPHPREMASRRLASRIKDCDRVKICDYLQRGFPLFVNAISRELYYRSDSDERKFGKNELTDGVYIWPDSLPHYITRYSIGLPPEFIQHVIDSPLCTHEIIQERLFGSDSIDISLARWYQWCRRWRSNRLFALLSFLDRPS